MARLPRTLRQEPKPRNSLPMIPLLIPLGTGKCSTFGGMADKGVGTKEELSCVGISDFSEWWFRRIFLAPGDYSSAYGPARNLDPAAFYCACRWAYGSFGGVQGEILPGYTREQVRRGVVIVSANGKNVACQAADFGPNPDTKRLIDLSPGAATALGVKTDDTVTVQFLPLL